MSPVNTLAAFRALLLGRSGVTALVGQNVGAPGTRSIADLPYIVLQRTGGRSGKTIPDVTKARIDVRCTAETAVEASDIYQEVLKLNGTEDIEEGSFHFYGIDEIVAGRDLIEPITDEKNVYTVMATFEVAAGPNL